MFTTPVLIGIAVLFATAIIIGLKLSSRERGPAETSADSSDSSQFLPDSPSESAGRFTANASFGLNDLSERLRIPLERLQEHQPTYREVRIAKPRGGFRRLEIPDDETKTIQRTLLKQLLLALNAHPMACAFEEGASIVDAAMPHQQKHVVVKMDIRHFFESTTSERVEEWFRAIGWNEEAAGLLTRLTTHLGHLPQGAPTSPRLSNLVNAPLDQGLLQLARKHEGSYSRYADDITMSFGRKRGRVIRGLTQVVRRILKSYGYSMHGGEKLKILRQNQRQVVLGLVVNDKVALPRKTRRWLRAVRHHVDNGKPSTLTKDQLHGWEALNSMVEGQRDE